MKRKILIVDDEPFNIDYLEQELEDLDCETIPAANGQEALDRIAEELPDMVLLDIMMPVMDGFEVLRRLKAAPDWRDIPVVIISALSDMDHVVQGIQMGADDYLPKPFNPTLLNARVTAGLARKSLRDMEKIYLQSLERELEIGHSIQSDFLPRALPEVDGWEMASYFQAAREVAGDFYDVFHLADGKLGFFLGDVTDKGVGSALYMSLYRSLLRAFLNADNYLSKEAWVEDPAELLVNAFKRTNQYVTRTHEDALFVSLFAGILDLASGRLVYINAGHNPPKIVHAGEIRAELKPDSMGLGIMEGIDYHPHLEDIAVGELLFIYSDGAEDTQDSQRQFFGYKRLDELIRSPGLSASALIERVAHSLAAYRGEASQYDDITLLALGRK